MSKWLDQFSEKNLPPMTPTQNPISTNCANCTRVRDFLDELNNLNRRWQKAVKLDEDGAFKDKSPEYQEKVCQELRQICRRATEIWEALTSISPEVLKDMYCLEPNV